MLRRSFLVAIALTSAAPARAGEVAVTIDNFTFSPETITVAAGTRIVWTNHDDIPHSVVSAERPPPFKSPVMDTDEKYDRAFDTPGRYDYFCGLHPHMKGTVVVQ